MAFWVVSCKRLNRAFYDASVPQTTFKSEENAITNLLDSGFWQTLLLWEILNDFGGLLHKIPSEAVDKTTLILLRKVLCWYIPCSNNKTKY